MVIPNSVYMLDSCREHPAHINMCSKGECRPKPTGSKSVLIVLL